MAYIGKSPTNGVRTRFLYTATDGQTAFSGSDSSSNTLVYTDGMYMDVYQNGVLLKPTTDYAATNGTTVTLTTGAQGNDVLEMVVYDVFNIQGNYTKTESDTRYPYLGNDSIIRTNGNSITADITIPSGTNGLSAGPITVTNATITVNGVYTIV